MRSMGFFAAIIFPQGVVFASGLFGRVDRAGVDLHLTLKEQPMHRPQTEDELEDTIEEPAPEYSNPDDDEFMLIEDGDPIPEGWEVIA